MATSERTRVPLPDNGCASMANTAAATRKKSDHMLSTKLTSFLITLNSQLTTPTARMIKSATA
jgi:hypothetical protein